VSKPWVVAEKLLHHKLDNSKDSFMTFLKIAKKKRRKKKSNLVESAITAFSLA
jgi:hypothetical protein